MSRRLSAQNQRQQAGCQGNGDVLREPRGQPRAGPGNGIVGERTPVAHDLILLKGAGWMAGGRQADFKCKPGGDLRWVLANGGGGAGTGRFRARHPCSGCYVRVRLWRALTRPALRPLPRSRNSPGMRRRAARAPLPPARMVGLQARGPSRWEPRCPPLSPGMGSNPSMRGGHCSDRSEVPRAGTEPPL